MTDESRSPPVGGSSPEKPKLAYRMAEAVIATGLSETTLYRDIASGRLKAKKRGSARLILADDLNAYLQELPDG